MGVGTEWEDLHITCQSPSKNINNGKDIKRPTRQTDSADWCRLALFVCPSCNHTVAKDTMARAAEKVSVCGNSRGFHWPVDPATACRRGTADLPATVVGAEPPEQHILHDSKATAYLTAS